MNREIIICGAKILDQIQILSFVYCHIARDLVLQLGEASLRYTSPFENPQFYEPTLMVRRWSDLLET